MHQKRFTLADSIGRANVGMIVDQVRIWNKKKKVNEAKQKTNANKRHQPRNP